MSIKIQQSLKLTAPLPIDTRILLSKAAMKDYSDIYMPEKYFAVCSDDGQIYVYDKSCTSPSEETGKFKPIGISLGEAEDGQILMYKNAQWTPVDLADENSIIYVTDKGLQIKGYDEAAQGYMLVKDTTAGISWIKPLSEDVLNQKVMEAQGYATAAGQSATAAGNSAAEATRQAGIAESLNEQTVEYVENKFWWGTLSEYNQLESINEGTFYYVQLDE